MLQLHVKLPSVLVQLALESHGSLVEHSSISAIRKYYREREGEREWEGEREREREGEREYKNYMSDKIIEKNIRSLYNNYYSLH